MHLFFLTFVCRPCAESTHWINPISILHNSQRLILTRSSFFRLYVYQVWLFCSYCLSSTGEEQFVLLPVFIFNRIEYCAQFNTRISVCALSTLSLYFKIFLFVSFPTMILLCFHLHYDLSLWTEHNECGRLAKYKTKEWTGFNILFLPVIWNIPRASKVTQIVLQTRTIYYINTQSIAYTHRPH